MYEYPAELYTFDTMPNGLPNRCTATTTKGRQCKNPVFEEQVGSNSQQIVGYVDEWPAYRPMVKISREQNDQMIAGTCYIHAR